MQLRILGLIQIKRQRHMNNDTATANSRAGWRQRLLLLMPMLLAFIMGVFLWHGIGEDPNQLESNLIDKPMPAFSGVSLLDEQQLLQRDDLLGRPALLNIWATWCASCATEHPYLMQMTETEQVRIIGVNYHDQRPEAIDWLKRLGNPYEFIVFDQQGDLGIELGVTGAPETYLLDATGIIRAKHIGVLNERTWPPLRQQYQQLLTEAGL
jgi:cytochrome c biogenesis protein CcmG/thiol:disulfide interchange protein DsbE